MKLYNSLSLKKENIEDEKVKIYACGPTVYDYMHIGNARPLIFTDLIIRILKFRNKSFKYLLNITDVDDKIINKIIATNSSFEKFIQFYINAFLKDFNSLNLNKPSLILKVSNNIPLFLKVIKILISKKKAYISNGNVFFDIKSINDYGILSKNIKKKLLVFNKDFNKKSQFDFVLWKKTSKGIRWDSNWSKGRPGWHLECATFIDHYFKDSITIHIGGTDLKFPHHENERAIFKAKNNIELSKIWIHNGHVNINHMKMSKSLNNVFYIKDFLKQYNINILKYLFYLKRYSQPLNINEKILSFVEREVRKIENVILNTEKFIKENKISLELKGLRIYNLAIFKEFMFELENDLNTANALEILKKIIKQINISLKKNNLEIKFYFCFLKFLNILGFYFKHIDFIVKK